MFSKYIPDNNEIKLECEYIIDSYEGSYCSYSEGDR